MYQIYGLDPLYCISTPGFTNRAMLKMTSVEIKLMTDLNMHLMIENGIRGGKCEPIYYHANSNNKYVYRLCVMKYNMERLNLIVIFLSTQMSTF